MLNFILSPTSVHTRVLVVDAAAVSERGVKLGPVVEQQVGGGSPGVGRAVRDDGQDVLDYLLL